MYMSINIYEQQFDNRKKMSNANKKMWKAIKIQKPNEGGNEFEASKIKQKVSLEQYLKKVNSEENLKVKGKESQESIIQELYEGGKSKEMLLPPTGKKKVLKTAHFKALSRLIVDLQQNKDTFEYEFMNYIRQMQFELDNFSNIILRTLEKETEVKKSLQNKCKYLQNQLKEKQQTIESLTEHLTTLNDREKQYDSAKDYQFKIQELNMELAEKENTIKDISRENQQMQELIFDYRQQLTDFGTNRKHYEDFLKKKFSHEAKQFYLGRIKELEDEVQRISNKEKQQSFPIEQQLSLKQRELALAERQRDLESNMMSLYENVEDFRQQHRQLKAKQVEIQILEKTYLKELEQLANKKQYYNKRGSQAYYLQSDARLPSPSQKYERSNSDEKSPYQMKDYVVMNSWRQRFQGSGVSNPRSDYLHIFSRQPSKATLPKKSIQRNIKSNFSPNQMRMKRSPRQIRSKLASNEKKYANTNNINNMGGLELKIQNLKNEIKREIKKIK